MRSIERKFNQIVKKNPLWSSYVCFSETVEGGCFTEKNIRYYFNRLVNKNDYLKSEKKAIIKYLLGLSKSS